MANRSNLHARLAFHLAAHQRVFDPQREPRNRLPWLKPLQAWQSWRLERSFGGFLKDPACRPAALFFLTDMYGERDFSQRDADIARVIPRMQRLLPLPLLDTIVDGIALGALSHAFDLRMAEVLGRTMPRPGTLDVAQYVRAYRTVGHPRLRAHQIALIDNVGQGLAAALKMPGVGSLLKVSRLPARAAGLMELQSFLERGYGAFARLEDPRRFLGDIRQRETVVMQRLFDGDRDPFGFD